MDGTEINFVPSGEIFSSIKFSFAILEKKVKRTIFLNKGIKIILNDFSQKKQRL